MAGKQKIVFEKADQAYVVPDNATSADIDALIDEAKASGLALWDTDGNIKDEDTVKAGWFADAVDALTAKRDEVVAVETEAAEAKSNLRGRFGDPAPAADDTPEPDAAPTAEVAPEVKAADVVEPVVVTAAAVANSTTTKPAAPSRTRGTVALTAAAGFDKLNAGESVDFGRLGEMFVERARGFQGVQGTAKVPVGAISATPDREALVASADRGDFDNITDALKAAADEKQLDGGSLVASSGWCAPSEVLYDLLDLTSTDGLLTVPTVTARRGGVRWTVGPSFADVINNGMGTQTEAQNIADTTKPSFVIGCPGFNEARMSADFLFLTNGILQEYAYPEAVQDYVTKALKAFEHYVSGKTIADQVAGSTVIDYTPATGITSTGAASTEILGALEMQAMQLRYRHRMPLTTGLEVKLPVWIKGVLRSDLAKRPGFESVDVTDAQLTAYFAARNIAVEYVYDWQDGIISAVTNGFGASTGPKVWPTSVDALMYPAGTWARAQADVIRIDALYDSALLAQNKQVQLFMERGRLSIKQGPDSLVVRMPLAPSGGTGAAIAYSAGQP